MLFTHLVILPFFNTNCNFNILVKADLRLFVALTLRLKEYIILVLGDALHRQECTLKNSKPTMIKSLKIDQKLNARDLFSSGRKFAYAQAYVN